MNKNHFGFTLVEIIITIIIASVLVSAAIPRLFRTIQSTTGAEAINSIGLINRAIDRCFFITPAGGCCTPNFDLLDIDDPGASPGASFNYIVAPAFGQKCIITAISNSNAADRIMINYGTDPATRIGMGIFESIK